MPNAITCALPSAIHCRGQALESRMPGNSLDPFGEGPKEKGCMCSIRPSAYSTLFIGHN
jgi:hypothetical protein